MVEWNLRLTKEALTDAELLKRSGLENKANAILALIKKDPYQKPPRCEKLLGDLAGFFSRRITLKDRLVYKIIADSREIIVYQMCSHYGE